MTIYDYLKMDHEHVKKLFKQFESSTILARKKQIIDLICQELLLHAHSEQDIFYNALEKFDLTKDEALHGKKEHQEMLAQINLVLDSKEINASWIKKVEKLKDLIEHHIQEEEEGLFNKARQVLSDEDTYVLKEQMHYLKEKLRLLLIKDTATNSSEKQTKSKNNQNIHKNIRRREGAQQRFH